jgi:hypothetical protein
MRFEKSDERKPFVGLVWRFAGPERMMAAVGRRSI